MGKPAQLGLSGHQQDSQANMVRFIKPSRSWERLNAKLVSSLQSQGHLHQSILTSKTPTHTQHKESVPSLLHNPSGPDFPSSAIQGFWRRKPTLQLCLCGFQTHQVYQANQAPIPTPNTVRRPTIARRKLIINYSLTRKMTPKRIIQS